MNIFDNFKNILLDIANQLLDEQYISSADSFNNIIITIPKEKKHGHISTNMAMVLKKYCDYNIVDLANNIKHKLQQHELITNVEFVNGFINAMLLEQCWQDQIVQVLSDPQNFDSTDLGNNQMINIEYVSANPTGLMHIGHARCACFGDVLANLLQKVNYQVTREYYINDAGQQIKSLAKTVYEKYLVLCNIQTQDDLDKKVSSNLLEYYNEYTIQLAESIYENKDLYNLNSQQNDLKQLSQIIVKTVMQDIKYDLSILNVKHDVFRSEQEIVTSHLLEEVYKLLKNQNLLYYGKLDKPKGIDVENWENADQWLFKSTQFGDSTDRCVIKNNGDLTYFGTDIVYHYDKYKRGFNNIINILGSDHGGYIKRISAAAKAFSNDSMKVETQVCQLVKLVNNNKAIRMSKRAGNVITLRNLIEDLGSDAVRFFMLTCKNDTTLEINYKQVLDNSKDNPLFYIQYAYARSCSVKRKIQKIFDIKIDNKFLLAKANPKFISDANEIFLLRLIAYWPNNIKIAATTRSPHKLINALYNIASEFHSLWNKGNTNTNLRFIDENSLEISLSRFALVWSVALTIANGLKIFGIKPMEEMTSE